MQVLTESSTDHGQRNESGEHIAFDIRSETQRLHDNECNEEEGWQDEAGESTDQDPLERVEKVA